MATNLRATGIAYDYTVPNATTIKSSDPVLIGERLGVALTDGNAGDVIAVQVEGVWTIKKVTGTGKSFTQGQKVYWDATNKQVDTIDNSAANKHIGWAYEVASTTDTTVSVDLIH